MRRTVSHARGSRLGTVMIASLALAAPVATGLLFGSGIASANSADAVHVASGRDGGGVAPLAFERQATFAGPGGSARCFSGASSAGATGSPVVALVCI